MFLRFVSLICGFGVVHVPQTNNLQELKEELSQKLAAELEKQEILAAAALAEQTELITPAHNIVPAGAKKSDEEKEAGTFLQYK